MLSLGFMIKMIPVVLIQPPFGNIEVPSLGLTNLKSTLIQNGIKSVIIYGNLAFAKKISPELYHKISLSLSTKFMCEWIFSNYSYPNNQKKQKQYGEKAQNQLIDVPLLNLQLSINDFVKVEEIAGEYLEEFSNYILNFKPKIVGFSCMFQQTTASVAIAKILKSKADIITVLGGVSCSEPMGKAILDVSPSIDYIFSGEAEIKFIEFCKKALTGSLPDIHNKFIECEPIDDLDCLPYPDYSDFFAQKEEIRIKLENESNRIWFESSRGCWWGEKKHCLFCGFHGPNMKYRSKSPKRIKNEINYLIKTYDPEFIQATDSIMPSDLPKTVFNSFVKPPNLKSIYYEVKPIYKFNDLWILKNGGINSFQPGLESLNDNHLNILNKGLTAVSNIRFLRDCRTLGIRPDWNILHSIPGETDDDYEEIIHLLPYLYHFQPPVMEGPLQIQRYSPLFNDHQKYKIKNLRPLQNYSYIFPEETDFWKLALFFDGEYDIAYKDQIKKRFLKVYNQWKELWKETDNNPKLFIINLNNREYMVHDTRPIASQEVRILNKSHAAILRELREPKDDEVVYSFVKHNNVEGEYEDLINSKFILKVGNRFISLVTEPMWILELEEEAKKIS